MTKSVAFAFSVFCNFFKVYLATSSLARAILLSGFYDASPNGTMMHLLRKYDVAPFGRNDVMFAKNIRRSQHHLPQADIIEKSTCISKCFFLVGEDGFAFLRKSHGRANSPPDCLLGPAFRIRPPNTQTHKKSNQTEQN